jgi:TolB protein
MFSMEVRLCISLICVAAFLGCRAEIAHAPDPAPAAETRPAEQDSHYSPNAVQHTFYEVGETVDPALSWDGGTLYFASSQNSAAFDIYCKKIGEIPAVQVTSGAADKRQPCVSPNGKYLAYVWNKNGNWDIFLLPLYAGAKPIQLTNSPSDDVHPSWSPDGMRIVYSSYNPKAARWELMVITLGRQGWEITALNVEGLFPAWQPVEGSETIVFQKPRGRSPSLYGLWTVTSDGKQLTEIVDSTAFGAVTPAWSRDGKWIVFSSVPADSASEGRAGNLWLVGADGKPMAKISEGTAPEYSPACAPDGTIYFTTLRNGAKNIWSLTPDYGNDETKEEGLAPPRSDVSALERAAAASTP